ncbi:uncharacterized protein LOC128553938 [Mercenaria mercenaria]|uniref:uncharacterized protein LOC128553938 n=1 Tax=Mercenaria mercenaria TaxID=6596 RepID=UPI00234E483B|nr:uncharacterized protein LOC128553938 [Mercenaria mercenaria]
MDLRRAWTYSLIISVASCMITCGLVFFNSVSSFPRRMNKEITTSRSYQNASFLSKSNLLSKAKAMTSLDFLEMSDRIQLNKIIVKNEKDCHHYKFIVYKCDYSRRCGGWGDRQKGIVSSFLLAMITGRAFVINLDKPCSLKKILNPHFYDWSVCKTFVNSINNSNTNEFDFVGGSSFFDDLPKFDFSSKWTWQVVFLKTNSNLIIRLRKRKEARQQFRWLFRMTEANIFNVLLQTLFQPRGNILNFLDQFESKTKGKSLVSSHIRKGQNPSIPEDDIFREIPDETIIFNFLKKFTTSSKYVLYLATDSNSVRQTFSRTFNNSININETIVHIDRLGKFRMFPEKACEGFKFAIIEQYILSESDVLILTDSWFGKIAGYMRGKSDHLYAWHQKSRRVVLSDLRHI